MDDAVGPSIGVGVKESMSGGKLPMQLIPPEAMDLMAEAFAVGMRKYPHRNWELGLPWGEVYGALIRHANTWWGGEPRDIVDGHHHLGAAMACAAMLIGMEYRGMTEFDDREPGWVPPTREEIIGLITKIVDPTQEEIIDHDGLDSVKCAYHMIHRGPPLEPCEDCEATRRAYGWAGKDACEWCGVPAPMKHRPGCQRPEDRSA